MSNKPEELTRDELVRVLTGIVESLYPGGDPDHQWSPETLEHVADHLESASLIPGE